MSFLISDAFANTGTAATAASPGIGNSNLTTILFLVVFFAAFYFLILRPQNKRAKEQRSLISNLAKGDEVVTSGGLVGKIVQLDDQFLELEISEGIKVKVQRFAVSSCLPKGTLKV
ncbi:MAG: preprotein translocase subunit YajC [Legionellales bacterium]|nr:preprotein translocase subunit YajC [Legionellales bacterium]